MSTPYGNLAGAKIGYTTLSGHRSTAYLDDEPLGPDGFTLRGIDKYTDEPVHVALTSQQVTRGWMEVHSLD